MSWKDANTQEIQRGRKTKMTTRDNWEALTDCLTFIYKEYLGQASAVFSVFYSQDKN